MTKSFEDFNLIPEILAALKKKGYISPTPIQEQSIPILLKGRDLIGIAQTGTGKTASFSLPIIQHLAKNKLKAKQGRSRVLILTPTRELASQIDASFKEYGRGLGLSSCVVFGGVGIRPQIKNMQKGQQVLIATPGRLLDLMNQGFAIFDQLEIFVLDEADRMLDMGFINDIKKIITKLPREKQTLLFSATMSKEIEKIASGILKNPKKVEVTPQATTVEKIDQSLVFVEKKKKPLLLKEILDKKNIQTALVFSRTKHGCDRIVKTLEKCEITGASIHGNKSQNAREKALADFKSGKVQVLVATDIAARGIDIPSVEYVFNYDIPNDPTSYVHRIGRTARAGRSGSAIAFCDNEERKYLKAVEKTIKYKIPIDQELTAYAQSIEDSVSDDRAPAPRRQRPSKFNKKASKKSRTNGVRKNRRNPIKKS